MIDDVHQPARLDTPAQIGDLVAEDPRMPGADPPVLVAAQHQHRQVAGQWDLQAPAPSARPMVR